MMPFRMREPASHNASPSVSMESGTYRMRAPRSIKPIGPLDFTKTTPRNQDAQPTRNRQQDHLFNRNVALLLIVLTLASIACFCAAYYLFTRWALVSGRHSWALADYSTEALAALPDLADVAGYVKPKLDLGERFLAYLPHSGFHNQRIEFQNALVLSKLLNRTLLVPPVHLARKPTPYFRFDVLYQSLALSGREGLRHCATIPEYLSIPPECLSYHESTSLPWHSLFDLSSIEATQPLVYLQDLSHLAFISDQNFSPEDTFVLHDTHPYQYRFVGQDTKKSHRYEEDITLAKLRQISQPLLQLGSLFGSHRIVVPPEDSSRQEFVASQLVINHPALAAASLRIRQTLSTTYIGLHLRVGDGHFFHTRHQIILRVWCTLLVTLGLDNDDIRRIIQFNRIQFQHPFDDETTCQGHFPAMVAPSTDFREESTPLVPRCIGHPAHRNLGEAKGTIPISLFISTDLERPRSRALLQPILKTFPCSFFLSDFKEITKDLVGLKNGVDGVGLEPFFRPFLDAMVVANAAFVVGTDGSTFSSYIEKTLWPSYHNYSDVTSCRSSGRSMC